jgi:hypothetical protein
MKKIATALAALATVAAVGSAQAQATTGPQGYALVSIGQSRLAVDCDGLSTCDESATGGKLTVGHGFGNGFSVEASYLNFGKFRAADGPLRLSARPEALALTGAFTAPLSDSWSLVGRLGVAQVRTKLRAEAGTLSGSDSENNTQPIAGAALNWAVSPTTRLELGIDATRAEYEGERSTVRLISLGARFAF